MQRSSSFAFWASLVSGEHAISFERLERLVLMDYPREKEATVQSSDSSPIDDPDDTTTLSVAATMPSKLHLPLHLSTTGSSETPDSDLGKNIIRIKKPPKKRKWRKPKDMPKRPLSAYNIFFQDERKKITDRKSSDYAETSSLSPMGFAGLAQNVAAKWRSLDSSARAYYDVEANKDQVRYRKEVDEWKRRKEERKDEESEHEALPPSSASSIGHTTGLSISDLLSMQQNTSNSQYSQNVTAPEAPSPHRTPQLALWPSPQTIESLGSLYDANVDLLEGSNATQGTKQDQENPLTDILEPLPMNISEASTSRVSSLGVTVVSSLHQLLTDMDEEELDFLTSLRDLK